MHFLGNCDLKKFFLIRLLNLEILRYLTFVVGAVSLSTNAFHPLKFSSFH